MEKKRENLVGKSHFTASPLNARTDVQLWISQLVLCQLQKQMPEIGWTNVQSP
jgi:hypothetical protein